MEPFPELQTPLSDGIISLRRFTFDDVDVVTMALQDPEIVRWTASIPIPYSEVDARRWIDRHAEHWDSGTTAHFAIVDASDGALLGNINVIVLSSDTHLLAMMYWVAPWARRKGVATRALVLASGWAFDVSDPRELHLDTLEGNVASERVAEKAGYVSSGSISETYTRPPSRGTPETLRVKEWILTPPSGRD
jgi:RimJ/RimL family protein N-acetyltransferase